MPRFGTRSLLIAFALLALWFSTFSGFTGAQDVRRSMLLLILVAVTSLAIYCRGRRRVFWAGFATVMFLCGGLNLNQPLYRYVPDFAWQNMIGVGPQPYPIQVYSSPNVSYSVAPPVTPAPASPYQQPQIIYPTPAPTLSSGYQGMAFTNPSAWLAMTETLIAVWTFALAALSGFIAAYVYSQTRLAISPSPSAARQIVEQELQR